jgi:hypothetical protein
MRQCYIFTAAVEDNSALRQVIHLQILGLQHYLDLLQQIRCRYSQWSRGRLGESAVDKRIRFALCSQKFAETFLVSLQKDSKGQ